MPRQPAPSSDDLAPSIVHRPSSTSLAVHSSSLHSLFPLFHSSRFIHPPTPPTSLHTRQSTALNPSQKFQFTPDVALRPLNPRCPRRKAHILHVLHYKAAALAETAGFFRFCPCCRAPERCQPASSLPGPAAAQVWLCRERRGAQQPGRHDRLLRAPGGRGRRRQGTPRAARRDCRQGPRHWPLDEQNRLVFFRCRCGFHSYSDSSSMCI